MGFSTENILKKWLAELVFFVVLFFGKIGYFDLAKK